MTRSRTWSCLLVSAGLLLVGCGSNSPAASEPTGPAEDALLTLRIGTDDEPGLPAANAIVEFARQVENRSNGRIVIDPVWHAAGEEPDDWDQAVARMVVDGQLDLGLIPSRAWDTEGVNSLRALNAPFLVTSKTVVDEVVTGDLSEDLLAGLDKIGVTGLALLPEGMRHVFWWGEPLLAADDFAGATIRAPRSATTYALFEALGATPDDLVGGAGFDAAVNAGSVAGAESSFALATGLPGSWTTTAGNLTLFPKINSLVANAAAFSQLTTDQQTVIAAAAEATRDWAVATTADEPADAEMFCAAGGTVVLASQGQIESLVEASQSVYEELERDEGTHGLIKRIRALAVGVAQRAEVAACEPDRAGAGAETPLAPVGDEPVTMVVNSQILPGLSDSPVLEASGPLADCTNVLDDGATVSHPDPHTDVFRGEKRIVCDDGVIEIRYEATMSRAAFGHTTGTWKIISSSLSGVTGGSGHLVGDGDSCEPLPGSEGAPARACPVTALTTSSLYLGG